MIEPTEKDIGRKVYYTGTTAEEGIITSINDNYVFVRYGDKINSQATKRDDLEWVFANCVKSATEDKNGN